MKRLSSTGLVCLMLLMLVVACPFCGSAHAINTPQTLFTTQHPTLPNVHVGPYELGTEFTSSVSGGITAIRFWKSSSETGQHIGHIWSASGQLLASVTFTSETASGWQQQSLPSPLGIAANTAYVVSVNSGSNAYYAATTSGLVSQVVNQDLSTVLGNNGVYGPPGQFPTTSYKQSNYFRDIIFSAGSTPVSAQPAISVVPASVSFGGVTVGTTNTQTITVSNQGIANLNVSQATVSGSGFKLSGLQLPLTVAPGNSAAFTVSFAPTTTANTTGTFTLVSNAPTSPTTIRLGGGGSAVSVKLTANPSSLSFGNVNVRTSSSQTVTLTNTGNASVTVSGGSVTGAGFTISGLTPLSLGAGQSTAFGVNFAPTATGSVSGNVLVSSNATNSPAQIGLTGSGVSTPVPAGPLAAFPGAQGGGAVSVGGRGGVVYEVTNLNDSGTGSLRACVGASGPRTCVFRTGGTITLQSGLHVLNPYLTIAGQTAPGGGIQLTNDGSSGEDLLRVGTHDVIVRFVRGRITSPMTGTPSPFSILNESANVYNVIFDHVSAAWAGWDNFDFWMGSFNNNYFHNVTVQWSVSGEPNFATNGGTSVQISGANSAISDQVTDIDIHHNFITGGDHRNPIHRVKSGRIINNVVYNASYYDIKAGGIKDIIGNYLKRGPYTGGASLHEIQTWITVSVGTTAPPSLYIEGNAADSNAFNPGADQWTGGLTGLAPGEDNSDSVSSPISTSYRRSAPLAAAGPAITVDSAIDLVTSNGVLLPAYPNAQGKPGVGASAKLNDTACDGSWVSNRDSLDNRYVSELINGTGHSTRITSPGTPPSLVPGTPCASTLHDGIADQWKTNYGLSLTDTGLSARTAPNGYTYLENYLNGTDPNLTASTNPTTSLSAGASSPKATEGFLHTGLPSFWQRSQAIQSREIFLPPSADLRRRAGGSSLLAYPDTFSADPGRRFESNASASLTSNWKELTRISHID
jgi:hypothetical protein